MANTYHTRSSPLSQLGPLPALDTPTLTNLSPSQKSEILSATSKICRHLMHLLGVTWKSQPIDTALRERTTSWIRSEIIPQLGSDIPVPKRFLLSTDAGLTYTERVYEGGDFETKVSMVKYVSVAIYLDDMIDKEAAVAKEAEKFLVGMMDLDVLGGLSSSTLNRAKKGQGGGGSGGGGSVSGTFWLEQYRKVAVGLSRHMMDADPFVSNMLLHSCTLFIEGCALEHHIQRDQGRYFLIKDAAAEKERDKVERKLKTDQGWDVPMPLEGDVMTMSPDSDGDDVADDESYYLAPHGWPSWLRERSAVAEVFAITSFRAPGGVNIPTWLWVTAIPELRTIILSINDLLSFAKELLADDTTSALAVLTKERRLIGMPGTAKDGGWRLRDSFDEVLRKTVVAGARINRLLRPATNAARYAPDGRPYSIAELVEMVKKREEESEEAERVEILKALALKLWETHQRGYVSWHFESPRYRTYELFDWVREMMGVENVGPGWLTSCFSDAK